MDNQNTALDHRNTKNRSKVKLLAKHNKSNPRDEHDSKPGSDCVEESHRHHRQGKRQKIECGCISDHDYNRL